jgi:hypothetical protein
MTIARLLAAASVSLFAAESYGVVQSFSNAGGTFHWLAEVPNIGTGVQGRPLDVTQDASQGTTPNERSVWNVTHFHGSSGDVVPKLLSSSSFFFGPSQARIARSTTPSTYVDELGHPFQEFAIAHFNQGDLVGASQDWQTGAVFQEGSYNSGPQYPTGRAFVGLQFPMADGTHYGYIEMDFVIPTVFSWGYETDPNTPVVVPSPAGLAVAAAGLAALRRRR